MAKIVFVCPPYMEETLFAYPVIMQYLEGLLVMNKQEYKDVVIACENTEMHKVIQACWKWARVINYVDVEDLKDAELIFEFDTELAYELTKAIEKGMGESYAIQLGVGLHRILPPVLIETYIEERGRVLIADRSKYDRPLEGQNDWKDECDKLKDILHDNGIRVAHLDPGANFIETCCSVARASAVVGIRSTATLLASAAGKLVIELAYPKWGHKHWTTKWDNRGYRLMYGELPEMKAEFIWERMNMLAKGLSGKAAPQEEVANAVSAHS